MTGGAVSAKETFYVQQHWSGLRVRLPFRTKQKKSGTKSSQLKPAISTVFCVSTMHLESANALDIRASLMTSFETFSVPRLTQTLSKPLTKFIRRIIFLTALRRATGHTTTAQFHCATEITSTYN